MGNPQKLRRVVIKEELVELTGSIDGAIVLGQMIYWSERIRDFDRFIEEENRRADKEGIEKAEYQCGWLYKTADELAVELLDFKSPKTILRILDNLVENGWLSRRTNPKYRWDKTYQYRVNILKIQSDLYELGYAMEGYKARDIAIDKLSLREDNVPLREDNLSLREDNLSHRRVHVVSAIPEITTKDYNIKLQQQNDDEVHPSIIRKILSEHGIHISPNSHSGLACLEKLGSYTHEQLNQIARVLIEKGKNGKIKNAAGLLVQDPSICEKILSGEFYPELDKRKKKPNTVKHDEYKLYVPPENSGTCGI